MQQKHRIRTSTLYTRVNWAFSLVYFHQYVAQKGLACPLKSSIIIKHRTKSKAHCTSLLLSETVAQELQRNHRELDNK